MTRPPRELDVKRLLNADIDKVGTTGRVLAQKGEGRLALRGRKGSDSGLQIIKSRGPLSQETDPALSVNNRGVNPYSAAVAWVSWSAASILSGCPSMYSGMGAPMSCSSVGVMSMESPVIWLDAAMPGPLAMQKPVE